MKIVLASHNAGKIRELSALLNSFDITIIPQAELNINEAEETGLTFIENALIKARHASAATGLPALADDSGLVVDALNGQPGIYSARYAGAKATSKERIEKLLTELKHVPDEKRHAHFYCVLALLKHQHDPTPFICTGKWEGKILHTPRGEDGFGYDPIFYVTAEKKTAAELPLAIKNKISHRGLALQRLMTMLPDVRKAFHF